MPRFTGDRDWRVERLEPNDDTPLPGVIVRGFRNGEPVEDGPSWRFDTPEGRDAAERAAAEIVGRRNAEEARMAALRGA